MLAAFFPRDTRVAIVEVTQAGLTRRALRIGYHERFYDAGLPSLRRLYSPSSREQDREGYNGTLA